MALVKVKEKFQVTIPTAVRGQARLAVGDLVEMSTLNGTIVMTPKTVVDRAVEEAIAEGLRDRAAGRMTPKFRSVKDFKASLAR